jgi:glutathione S-transferase
MGRMNDTATPQEAVMSQIIFHSMSESAYLWTAMHVADEKGVAYALAPLEYRSPEHLALHPFGKMPVMQHGDSFLYETLAISHYIDKAFDGPALQPSSALGQSEMLRWISIVNSYVFPTMNRFMKERLVRPAFGAEPDKDFIEQAREPLALQMRLIDAALTRSQHLANQALTIADSFLLPQILFFVLTPEGADLLTRAPAAKEWLTRLCARPSYLRSPMRGVFTAMAGMDGAVRPSWGLAV